MSRIQIHNIEASSYTDGPGQRAVLFFQGCPLACPGCQNKALWSSTGGISAPVEDVCLALAEIARSNGGNVTLSGGEIFFQPAALAELVTGLKALGVKHIIAYTGYTWEELFTIDHPARPWLKEILEHIDVLVDGRFIKELDDPYITYRGSRNQRPIDVAASLEAGQVVTLDWDNEIVLTADGSIVLPEGFAREFAGMGEVKHSRMCGQVTK